MKFVEKIVATLSIVGSCNALTSKDFVKLLESKVSFDAKEKVLLPSGNNGAQISLKSLLSDDPFCSYEVNPGFEECGNSVTVDDSDSCVSWEAALIELGDCAQTFCGMECPENLQQWQAFVVAVEQIASESAQVNCTFSHTCSLLDAVHNDTTPGEGYENYELPFDYEYMGFAELCTEEEEVVLQEQCIEYEYESLNTCDEIMVWLTEKLNCLAVACNANCEDNKPFYAQVFQNFELLAHCDFPPVCDLVLDGPGHTVAPAGEGNGGALEDLDIYVAIVAVLGVVIAVLSCAVFILIKKLNESRVIEQSHQNIYTNKNILEVKADY